MKKFSREFNGYNKAEVNDFVNSVIKHTEVILKRIEEQKSEINELKNQIIHYQDIERSLNLALSNAQSVGDNIRRIANEESKLIIEDAKRNASRIVNDALIRNERIELKRQQAERNLRVFKNRLRTIVEQQLEVVEEIETLEVEE